MKNQFTPAVKPGFRGACAAVVLSLVVLLPSRSAAAYAEQLTFGTNYINLTSRETSRQFYNLVYQASAGVAMDWSGNYATSNPGTNSTAYMKAMQRRVNYFRAMAGVPADIIFDVALNSYCQAAALMMGASNATSHMPTDDWLYYTPQGSNAAYYANLTLGNNGPDAIALQMRANGTNEDYTSVSDRRWILFPQTQIMGAGNVPAVSPSNSACVLWTIETASFGRARPATRTGYVSWPPPGYVPYQVVYPRWSFSYPNANFSSTTVYMKSNATDLAVTTEAPLLNAGEDTLVWYPSSLNVSNLAATFFRPTNDTLYSITLSNVVIGATNVTFTYQVVVFDPAMPGLDYLPATVAGAPRPLVAVSNNYAFTAVADAFGYEYRASTLLPLNIFDGAEANPTNWMIQADTNLYQIRDANVRKSGTYSYHLCHMQPVQQYMVFTNVVLVQTNSALVFDSMLGWATVNQIARVQISTNSGASWRDVYSQAGLNSAGETIFTQRTASFGAYAGFVSQIRLAYNLIGGYYEGAGTNYGWHLDNLVFTNLLVLNNPTIAAANSNRTFAFVPASTNRYLVDVRPLLFTDYAGAFGPGMMLNPGPYMKMTGMQRTNGNFRFDFNVTSGNADGFEVWSAPSLTNAFTKETGASIQTIIADAQYRATVPTNGALRFYRLKAP